MTYKSVGVWERLESENAFLRDQNEQMVKCILNLTKILSQGVKPVGEWEISAAQTTNASENGDLGQVARAPALSPQSPETRSCDGTDVK